MARDGCMVFPFVDAFMMLAMAMHGGEWKTYAYNRFKRWCNNAEGFYEWYDCVQGEGHGSRDQLWTAALFIRLYETLDCF